MTLAIRAFSYSDQPGGPVSPMALALINGPADTAEWNDL